MHTSIRKMLILALLGLMLVSASTPVLGSMPRGVASLPLPLEQIQMPNIYFQNIVSGSSQNTTQNTTFSAPFVYNPLNFTVTGKFISFRFFGGSAGSWAALYNVFINQTPFSNVSRTVYSQFQVLSPLSSPAVAGVIGNGSLFYAYSNNTLLVVHDNPQALIQVFTYQANATVVAVLSEGLHPNTKFTATQPTGEAGYTNGTVAMMFNDSQLAGYFVSEGSGFSDAQAAAGGSFYITKTIPENSFLNTFSAPNGNSPLSSALYTIAQGMRHNAISYYASIGTGDDRTTVDAAYYNNALRVTNLTIAKGSVDMKMAPVQSALPNTVVLVFSNSVFNGSSSTIGVDVNGIPVRNSSTLLSLVNPYGNTTQQNVTALGSYTIVSVYSPTQISSLSVYVISPKPANILLTLVVPFAGAFAVITAAGILLFRRKMNSKE